MRKLWSKDEMQLLTNLYPNLLSKDVAAILNRSFNSVVSMAHIMKLKKSDVFFASSLSGRACKNNDIGHKTRFTKNMAGWNKGMKITDYMSAESLEKVKKNYFKKGQDPHNTVAIGSERITKDGYVEVKVRHNKGPDLKNKNFVLKQRMVYENFYGKIPPKMIIGFKDGNTLNFEITNLVLQTMAQNMIANSFSDNSIVKKFLGVKNPELVEQIKKEMPGLIDMKRNQILLNRKIKKADGN